jgi:hypothetical protein
VIRDDEFLKNYTIEVNRPLKIGRMKVYQSTYSQNFEASVSAPDGVMYTVRPGDYYWTEDSIVVFRGIEIEPEVERELKDDPCVSSGHAVFQEMTSGGEETGHTVRAVYRVAISEMIDQFTIEKLCISYTTGLQVVKDISFIPVIIALIMIGGGMSLAFIQKIGDTNK